jgi:hypothetical protein
VSWGAVNLFSRWDLGTISTIYMWCLGELLIYLVGGTWGPLVPYICGVLGSC